MMMKAAAGALGERESASLEQHLSACARCAAEMDDLRTASALFGSARTPVPEPPPDLASRVLDRIAAEAPTPPRRRAGVPLWRGGLALGMAAAGVVLVLVARNMTLDEQTLMTTPPELHPAATAPAQESARKALAPAAPAQPAVTAQSAGPRELASKPRVSPVRPRAKVAAGSGQRAAADGVKRAAERVPAGGLAEIPDNGNRHRGKAYHDRTSLAAAPGRTVGDAAFDAASAPAAAAPESNTLTRASRPDSAGLMVDALGDTSAGTRPDEPEARQRAEAVEDVYTSPDERAKTILSY